MKNKVFNWVKGLAVIMGLMVALTGCSAKADSTTTAKATSQETVVSQGLLGDIQKKGKLVLGTSADYAPYEYHKMIDGKDTYMGFDIAIAKDIATAAGVPLEIVDMKFDGLLAALQAGKVDMIIAGMNPTEERKKSVDFSIEYYEATQTFLVKNADAELLNTEKSFVGKKVGVQKGSTQEQLAADKFATSEIVAMAKIPDLIMALEAGKLDGVILNQTVAESYDLNSEALVVNGLNLGSEGGVAVALPKESGDLKTLVDNTLKELMDSGKLKTYITDAALAVEQ